MRKKQKKKEALIRTSDPSYLISELQRPAWRNAAAYWPPGRCKSRSLQLAGSAPPPGFRWGRRADDDSVAGLDHLCENYVAVICVSQKSINGRMMFSVEFAKFYDIFFL